MPIPGIALLPHLHVSVVTVTLKVWPSAGLAPSLHAFHPDGHTACADPDGSRSAATPPPSHDLDSIITWTIAGHGYPRDECTTWSKVYACEDHLEESMRPVVHRCLRPDCPECYEYWAAERAERIRTRLQGVMEILQEMGEHPGCLRHFVISPDPEISWSKIRSRRGYHDLKQYVIDSCRRHGLHGGAMVFHSHRTGGILRPGPHFHILAWGHVTPTRAFKRATGLVIKNLGARSSVHATLSYLFSHVGLAHYQDVPDGRRPINAYHFFGSASTRVVGKREFKKKLPMECPHCNKQMQITDGPVPDQDGNPTLGDYYIVYIKPAWNYRYTDVYFHRKRPLVFTAIERLPREPPP